MKKLIIFAILLVLVFIFGIFIGKTILSGNLTARVVESQEYSWTKAICNAQNECFDILITCKNGKAEAVEPVSQVVRHSKNWQDTRENSSKLC